jgi:hypothetical protein
MKSVLVAVLALGCCCLGGFAWWQSQQIADLQKTLTLTTAQQVALQRHATESERQLADAQKAKADIEAKLKDALDRPAATPPAAGTVATADVRARSAAAMKALDNPAVQQLMTSSIKGTLDQRYGGLFRLLRLSPAELDTFKDLLAERQMSSLDAIRSMQTQGAKPGDMAATMGKMQADVDESIHTLLGDERYSQYQDFNQNIASYALLDQIERRLSYTSAPLDPGQSDQLLHVLIENGPPPPPGAAAAAMNVAQGMAGMSPIVAGMLQRPITDQAIVAAQAILSPEQVVALRQLQNEQRNQASALQSMRGNLGAGAAVPGTATRITPAPGSAPGAGK